MCAASVVSKLMQQSNNSPDLEKGTMVIAKLMRVAKIVSEVFPPHEILWNDISFLSQQPQ